MIYRYEMACKEAGLSEEQTKSIRQVFDTEKKHLKRKKAAQEEMKQRYGFGIYSLSEMHGVDEKEDFEPMDPDVDVEDKVIHELNLERLRKLLAELSEEDRELLLAYNEGTKGSKKAYRERKQLSKRKADYRVVCLVEELRRKF